jgi:nitroimidazol reductase NimA-like FMN-containing flavoprotein (pyridoxamine 5'-phosphate oxidase superfamily)
MRRIEPATGIEWLGRDECLELLSTEDVGRLAVVIGRTPTVFVVNYALDGHTVVFRSDPGSKVDAGLRGPVAFEVDEIDRSTRSGWSVVVTGRLEEPPPFDRAANEQIRSVPVEPWAGGAKDRWLRLVPSRITGRRI